MSNTASVALIVASLGALVAPSLAQQGPGPERQQDPYRAPSRPVLTSVPAPNGPRTRAGFQSVQVNVNAQGLNIVGDAANEPSIAVDPTNPQRMVIGWRQFDTISSNFRQAGWAYTRDGGAHWTFPGRIEPGVFRSDPVLEADRLGTFFYNSLQNDFSVQIFRSTDGGATWLTPPVSAFGGDKQWMVIDKTGGIGDGNIYEDWSTCCGNYPTTTFSRSVNRGASFQTPMAIPGPTTGGTLAVGPDGTLYTFGGSNTGFRVNRSLNAKDPAATPAFTSVIVNMGGTAGTNGTPSPNPGGGLGQYWIDVDRTPPGSPTRGNIYACGNVNPAGADPLDVMFIRSTDGGATWSTPVRINTDTQDANHWQWFTTMSVAPSGRIDVIWNDSRASNQSNLVELYYAWSSDAGLTWQGNTPVSARWDSFIGWPQQNKIGDYYDMESDIYGADVAYAATFNGEQDVYYLRLGRPKCPQDVNRDGAVNVQDFLAFLQNYGAGASAADFDGSGGIDVQDFLAFLAQYAAGCP